MGEFQYVYFSCRVGLFRVKIPNFDRAHKHEFKIELVFYNPSNNLPSYMGLFSHRHIVYMVGGQEGCEFEYSRRMYMFDPSKFQKKKFPVVDLDCLEKPEESCSNFEPMVSPSVIRAEDQIYFLSDYDFFCDGPGNVPFRFQSFDPTKNCFETQPSPPYPGSLSYRQFGHFFLRGYIYLFVMEDYYNSVHAYTFNTRSSEWKEWESLVSLFHKKKIPIPSDHSGDVGLSDDEFSDNTQILVALIAGIPTAYRVRLLAGGSFKPKSYRVLEESYIPDPAIYSNYSTHGWTHLAYIGGGRFCVIYSAYYIDLLMYVFKIDFALEHDIQISATGLRTSSEILSSKKFQFRDTMPLLERCRVDGFCLASAPPASQSFNTITASPSNEDQDRDDGDKSSS